MISSCYARNFLYLVILTLRESHLSFDVRRECPIFLVQSFLKKEIFSVACYTSKLPDLSKFRFCYERSWRTLQDCPFKAGNNSFTFCHHQRCFYIRSFQPSKELFCPLLSPLYIYIHHISQLGLSGEESGIPCSLLSWKSNRNLLEFFYTRRSLLSSFNIAGSLGFRTTDIVSRFP